MLKRQDIKLNSSGKVSCLLLLLLTFLLISPTTTSASALESEEDTNHDGQIYTQADSGVTISFTPSSGSASLTPTTSDGASAKINVAANVKIASTGGYTIYLGGKNSALTGEKTGEAISAMSGSKTFANLDTNTWGYAVVEGSSVPDTATYSALPQGQGISLESKSGNQSNVDKTYTISFATKIGNDKPADVYSNQVTLSVTSTPWQITQLSDINEMQSMTTKICEGSAIGDTKQLKDTRDGKYYWVSKLADGKCWMTQNLDLDLSTATTLYNTNTDLNSKLSWTPGFSTASQSTTSTVDPDSQTETRSWSLGNYIITNPNLSSDCGYRKNSASQCSSQFTPYDTPASANGDVDAHYILGNHYQWNAATAGSGGADTISGQATDSICPYGWRLPESNSTAIGSFGGLINAGTIGTDVTKLTSSPYYFVRGGGVWQDYVLFGRAGDFGLYWSSTPSRYGYTDYAHYLYFRSTDYVAASDSNNNGNNTRNVGFSVRCITR